MAVNTQLCLSASEDFDFHLTAQHTGVSGRQGRAWVWGEGGPGCRGGNARCGEREGRREEAASNSAEPCLTHASWRVEA